jgi:hypothetical protein
MAKRANKHLISGGEQFFDQYFKVDYQVWYPYASVHLSSQDVDESILDPEREPQCGILFYHKSSRRPIIIVATFKIVKEGEGEGEEGNGQRRSDQNIEKKMVLFYIYFRPERLDSLDTLGKNDIMVSNPIDSKSMEYHLNVEELLQVIDVQYTNGTFVPLEYETEFLRVFLLDQHSTLKFEPLQDDDEEEELDEIHDNSGDIEENQNYKRRKV